MLNFYARPTIPYKFECEALNERQNLASEISAAIQNMKTNYDSSSEGLQNDYSIVIALFTRLTGPCIIGGLSGLGVLFDREFGFKGGVVLSAWMTFCLCLYAGIMAIVFYRNFYDAGQYPTIK